MASSVRARPGVTYRKWEADESRTDIAPSDTLFKYRLVWANGRDAGRAAYHADMRPGDIILNYRGQWLRVLARTPIDDEESPYDGVLEIELTNAVPADAVTELDGYRRRLMAAALAIGEAEAWLLAHKISWDSVPAVRSTVVRLTNTWRSMEVVLLSVSISLLAVMVGTVAGLAHRAAAQPRRLRRSRMTASRSASYRGHCGFFRLIHVRLPGR